VETYKWRLNSAISKTCKITVKFSLYSVYDGGVSSYCSFRFFIWIIHVLWKWGVIIYLIFSKLTQLWSYCSRKVELIAWEKESQLTARSNIILMIFSLIAYYLMLMIVWKLTSGRKQPEIFGYYLDKYKRGKTLKVNKKKIIPSFS
jgi:hypothetical protein